MRGSRLKGILASERADMEDWCCEIVVSSGSNGSIQPVCASRSLLLFGRSRRRFCAAFVKVNVRTGRELGSQFLEIWQYGWLSPAATGKHRINPRRWGAGIR